MRVFISLLFVFTIATTTANDNPRQYLKFIDDLNEDVVVQTWEYMNAYTNGGSLIELKSNRKRLENYLLRALKKVQKRPTAHEDFKNQAKAYFEGNLAIVKKDLYVLLRNRELKKVEVDPYELQLNIRRAIVQLRVDYDNAVQNFAGEHNLQLEVNRSDVAIAMNTTMAAYDYYHHYNIQIKKLINLEQQYWTDLHNKSGNQLNSIENQLCQANLDLIEVPQLLNNDSSLVTAAQEYMSYIQTLCGQEFQEIKNFKLIESTGDRKKIAQATSTYNKAIKDANDKRRSQITQWQNKTTAFLQRHVKM
ncbi:hypothetical protein JCM19294_578 [Nonlabens tegetincola]|uniref:Uncharacterized protein n=1 Tax=Nonlabens tegetincola TaxID=323273 RepID=A0A090Q4F6_9FLAO|nr:hypothetical protein [Nonlabens tegetincola]GAK97072.1 hypothetical protein JCM19294_578 [Nonlabens tegetincola]